MPARIPVFTPPHLIAARKARAREYDDKRGSAHSRGYGGTAWERLRKRILVRDNYTCADCGCIVGVQPGDAHIDHIQSKRKGGTDDESNLTVRCIVCHGKKTRAGD